MEVISVCLCVLLSSQDGHNVFSWFFNVKLLDHLLHAELTLLFIHHFVALYLQLHTYTTLLQPDVSQCAASQRKLQTSVQEILLKTQRKVLLVIRNYIHSYYKWSLKSIICNTYIFTHLAKHYIENKTIKNMQKKIYLILMTQ